MKKEKEQNSTKETTTKEPKKAKKNKKKMKAWKKAVIILLSIVLVLSLALGGFVLYFRIGAKDYYSASSKAFRIPGLKDGLIPQGFEYDSSKDYFLVSGYMKNGSASSLYIVKKSTGESLKRTTFLNEDGTDYTGHFGGVARYNNYLYIAEGTSLLVYDYNKVIDLDNADAVECLGKISLKYSETDYVKASFVTVYNGTLIVGEFYDGDKYKTLPSHAFTSEKGDKNSALAVEFNLNTSYHLGIDTAPSKAYSLPNKVQGLCIANNRIYLSTSYGIKFSHILEYDKSNLARYRVNGESRNITVLGEAVPMYFLDSSSLEYDYKIAPMSEEILMIDNELYVMCESASKKYVFGSLIGAKWCYKTDLEKMR